MGRHRADWEDWLLALTQVGFALALLPTLLGPEKPAMITCLSTSVILQLCAWVYRRRELWWSAACCATVALEWILMYLQQVNWTH